MKTLMLLSFLWSSVSDSSEIQMSVEVPQDSFWVGQQVLIPVTLALKDRPQGSPRFRVPEVSGGVLVLHSGPVFGVDEREGVEYTTWTYSLAFYPRRAGEHEVPEIQVEVSLPGEGRTWRRVKGRTEAFIVRSKLPQGAIGLSTLVTAHSLEAKETWSSDRSEMLVGDAVTRTITLSAPDVPGIGFPPLKFEASQGVAVYPRTAVLDDEKHRGDLIGRRAETVVYVCESEGVMTLDGVVIPWFDPDSEALNQIVFDAREITVRANPAYRDEARLTELDDRGSTRFFMGIVLVLVVVVTVGTVVIHRSGRQIRRLARSARDKWTARQSRWRLPPLNPEFEKRRDRWRG